ncbi:hypothetical protein Tco_0399702 [Tanacetum coccineum]
MSQFHLPYGIQVVELPEEIGRLECLKELDITGTGICHLPRSGTPMVLIILAAGCIHFHGSDCLSVWAKLLHCQRRARHVWILLGNMQVHCKELPSFKYRHDMVRDVLFDICRRAGISAKKEAPVGGKHACVDLTGVSPLVGLSSRGFTVGQAALKAASCKVAKHEKTCIKNQHVFIPFAFDTFGLLAPEAVELLTRVQRVMNSNVMTPRFTNVVFNRIVFAIQKGLAAQLVARLPSPTM